jgi:hypothetical protein
MNRWEPFSDAELHELYNALTVDDGIVYGVERSDKAAYGLVEGIEEELHRRGRLNADEPSRLAET